MPSVTVAVPAIRYDEELKINTKLLSCDKLQLEAGVDQIVIMVMIGGLIPRLGNRNTTFLHEEFIIIDCFSALPRDIG